MYKQQPHIIPFVVVSVVDSGVQEVADSILSRPIRAIGEPEWVNAVRDRGTDGVLEKPLDHDVKINLKPGPRGVKKVGLGMKCTKKGTFLHHLLTLMSDWHKWRLNPENLTASPLSKADLLMKGSVYRQGPNQRSW